MLCSRCGKKEANVHFKQLADNELQEQRVCSDCAAKLEDISDPIAAPLCSLLSALGLQQTPAARKRLECFECGLVYAEFRKNGLLGCAGCYRSFANPLEEILREVHGATRHTGKTPPQSPAEESARLKKELETAVENENFEEAARIRDRLEELKCS